MRRTVLVPLLAAATVGTAVLATPAVAATGTDPATGCPTGTLPAVVAGQPAALHAGAAAGDYVWHDAAGWQLAVTHPGHTALVFTGRISATRPIRYTRVRDERDDRVWRSADGRTIWFRFVDYGYLDGVDFTTDCARTVGFSLQAAGRELPTTRVWLGRTGAHPTSNPFAVERH